MHDTRTDYIEHANGLITPADPPAHTPEQERELLILGRMFAYMPDLRDANGTLTLEAARKTEPFQSAMRDPNGTPKYGDPMRAACEQAAEQDAQEFLCASATKPSAAKDPAIEIVHGYDFSRARTRKRGRPKGTLGPTALAIRDAVTTLTGRYDRMTVRQVFYALEVAGVVAKTEGGYRQVQAQVLAMRREELLPWKFITDGTRWQRKPNTFNDASDYVAAVACSYRRDLWQKQHVRIEVWLEKDALADVVVDVTREWDVPLMVSRGQSSSTFLHSAAMNARAAWEHDDAQTFVYTLYDHDAGGLRAARTVERDLTTHAPDVPISVQQLAVTEAQITDWTLPTRPPKKKDPEAKAWGDKPCVELDAIPPERLTELVANSITRHVDQRAWKIEKAVEKEEREGLLRLAEQWHDGNAA